jgi:hypothetical protein
MYWKGSYRIGFFMVGFSCWLKLDTFVILVHHKNHKVVVTMKQLIGLGFGSAFAPIYAEHPDASRFGIFDPNQDLAAELAKRLRNVKVYHSFEEVLNDGSVDAVHP